VIDVKDTTITKAELAFRDREPYRIGSEKRAAVCIVLRPAGPDETRVLLIQRTTRPNDPWSGQMAFPGGRLEPDDVDALTAAFREAQEEVGLDLASAARLLGRCDDVRAMARGRALPLVISPFVFELTADEVDFDLQRDEVARVVWAPVEEMVSGRLDSTTTVNRPGLASAKLPCYLVDGKVVWGLTYLMLRNLFNIIELSR
jgi:8-oxo-dGTP pyrophosphatase MutT (NUDIX family)